MITRLAEWEQQFSCTPTRRLFLGIFLAGVFFMLLNYFLTGPFTDSILARVKDPITIYKAEIITPEVTAGGFVKIRLDSIKNRDCDGMAGTWLESENMTVYNLPENRLGVQPIGKRRIINIVVPLPERLPTGKYRMVRVLDYSCSDDSRRVRFPSTLLFRVVP